MPSDSDVSTTANAAPAEDFKDLCVGCINPRVLVEVTLGRKVDWNKVNTKQFISDTLGKQYDELFDLKHGSPLYAGLKLNPDHKTVVRAESAELKILEDTYSATPNLSVVKKLQDLGLIGVTDADSIPISQAWLTNGKLNLQLDIAELNRTTSNLNLTKPMASFVLGGNLSQAEAAIGEWNPPNAMWKDVGDFERDVAEMDDPIQGAIGDCWLIAALSAVAWALPYSIIHRTRSTGSSDNNHVSQLTFYHQGGDRDAATGAVDVTDRVLVNNVSNSIIYARSRDAGELWPALYEKAFAKWSTSNGTDKPDITTLQGGDCVKSIAQLTDRRPVYYKTSDNTPDKILGLVRANSRGRKTFNPMTAWTYPSGKIYNGSDIVAWHCYTILGWTLEGNKNYIVLRNPWGFNEPAGSTTFQGVVSFFDENFWRPISMISGDGIFALEASAFQEYYAGLGVAVPKD
ncbi:hypothetical protein FOXYS1_15628 [Fusarium oxysporum]|uniref:Calpain catalytic domain-containing protein n=1 Tax=Fusarium oxysporum TaxID=5507 RepID=A0A8H4YY68_FUSOX|nr:hypothetical protein FOXYS1_15628 [Fusarium oxysporum]